MRMKKKAVALAVGALFVTPAALGQTVQIYGKFYPQFISTYATGATDSGSAVATMAPAPTGGVLQQRNAIDTQNSYVGFRGEESLGGNLRAIWQVEQAVNFDTGQDSFWANRNSFLGLRHGAFGTVKLGNMDTIYKEYGDQFSMFGLNSGNFTSASNSLSHIGLGNARAGRFHERAPNSIQYETPEFANFTFGIQYSPDEQEGNPGRTLDQKLWSYGVKWETDRFYVSLHQEQHYDFFGGSANSNAAVANPTGAGSTASSKDVGTRLSGVIKLGDHQIAADIARLEYREHGQAAAGRFEKYERTNWAVGWEARWGGPFRTGIQYVNMDEGDCTLSGGVECSTGGLDGDQLNLGVAYDFSKRTFIYALASVLKNGHSALFDNWANGTPPRGSDIKQWALGIQHRF